jgi:serine/threonine protein kinase
MVDEDGLPLPPQALLPSAHALPASVGGAGVGGGFSASVSHSASPLLFELDPSALRSLQGSPTTMAADGSSPGHHHTNGGRSDAPHAFGADSSVRGSPPTLFDATGSEAGFAVALAPFAAQGLTSPDPAAALAAVAAGFREYRARWQGLSVSVHCLDFSSGAAAAPDACAAFDSLSASPPGAFAAGSGALVLSGGSTSSPSAEAAEARRRLFHLCLGRVRRELALLSTLRHPNCQLFIGATTAPPRIGVVLELLQTGSLSAFLHGRGAGAGGAGGGSGDGDCSDVGDGACGGSVGADNSTAASTLAVLSLTEGTDTSSGAGERPSCATGIEGSSGGPRASSGSLSRLVDSRSSSDAEGEGQRRQGFASGDTGATGERGHGTSRHARQTRGQSKQLPQLQQQPPLPWSLIRSIALDVARGLCYLHSLKMHAYAGDYRPTLASSIATVTTATGTGGSVVAAVTDAASAANSAAAATAAPGAASAAAAGSALVPFVHGALHPGACMLEEGLRVKIGCVRHTAITAAVEAARRRLGSVTLTGSGSRTGAVTMSGGGAGQAAVQAWGSAAGASADMGFSSTGAGASFCTLPQQRCPAAIALSRCLPVAYTAPEVLAWLGYTADDTVAPAAATPETFTAVPSPAIADAASPVPSPVTQAVDVFAFGMLLWELVERRSPADALLLQPQAAAGEHLLPADFKTDIRAATAAASVDNAASAASLPVLSTAARVAARLLAGARPPLPDPLGPRLGLGASTAGASGGGSSSYSSGGGSSASGSSGGTVGLGSRRAFLALMQRCWAAQPADRPTFAIIVSTLERLQPY